MNTIEINDCVCKVHPVYNLYASDSKWKYHTFGQTSTF